jgi:hypothetical protein
MFENYGLLHPYFMDVMNHGWAIPTVIEDRARKVGAKLKNLRRVLRAWHSQLSNLAATIENIRLCCTSWTTMRNSWIYHLRNGILDS